MHVCIHCIRIRGGDLKYEGIIPRYHVARMARNGFVFLFYLSEFASTRQARTEGYHSECTARMRSRTPAGHFPEISEIRRGKGWRQITIKMILLLVHATVSILFVCHISHTSILYVRICMQAWYRTKGRKPPTMEQSAGTQNKRFVRGIITTEQNRGQRREKHR